ncbi:MAG: phosphatidylglycerol lysyltransferase domain-containing protein [Treponema sp.]|nr:phosphatidylglycerol lysyltransferase domain-containing protein [Treponema sp.]
MSIPCYPDFTLLDINLKESMHPRLSLTSDGVSEFTFSSLYLFRKRYNYRISLEPQPSPHTNGSYSSNFTSDKSNVRFIISGTFGGKSFFMTPCGAPGEEILNSLFTTHDFWKNISESVLAPVRERLQENGIIFEEDRNNFDYLYYRHDLSELAGKKYHKKKNHVNHFLSAYPDHEQYPMSAAFVPAAMEILEQWRCDSLLKNSGQDNDYNAAREALELFDSLSLKGSIFFVNNKPAAFCLGESIAKGRMFVIHFEKAVEEYKGIYQFMNQEFASFLPGFYTFINREQDLGNEGLRQAKMTYRPCGYVKKYTGKYSAGL